MKFAYKMILGTTLIISILFSLGGILLIQQNFNVSYDTLIQNNIEEHVLERYSMEERVRSAFEKGELCGEEYIQESAEKLAGYGSKSNYLLIYSKEGACFYSNISEDMDQDRVDQYVKKNESEYELIENNNIRYMMLGSRIEVADNSFIIVNIYNITSLYEERDRQINMFLKLDLGIVLVAIVAVFILSMFLTGPIKKLNKVSTEIAKGAYDQRTNVSSRDEIGELSTSFDAMAGAIEEKINDLNQEIDNRENFISDFSHEMKTPMTSIMGYAKLLTNIQVDKEQQLNYAERIYRESKRLEGLSRKMLKLMEIDEEVEALHPIETSWLKEELILSCEPIMGPIQLTIELEAATILVDEVLLIDLLKNLVDNGRKACKDQGVVTVTGMRKQEMYEFLIEDNGCGIPKEELTHIMDPFYMVDKSRDRKQGGNGLGLALCKKICQYHHTELMVKSVYGEGSIFSFQIEVEHENRKEIN